MRNRAKEDEKKFNDSHETVVSVQERCRSMEEIMKFRQAEQKKGIKEVVTKDDIEDMDEQYENMIYEKEEN